MIRWGAPQLLWLLLAVPALLALLAAGAWLKRRALRRLADPELVPRLTASRSPRLATARTALLVLGLVLAILAAARPQWGEKLQVYKGRGIDVVIALDASKSMLATDVRPSRLARAKTELASLLDDLATNQVGIVAFAGDAHVLCPLTPDVEAARLFLDIIEPGNMPRPGTNIQLAVEAAASLFDPRQRTAKALLLVTDGDNLEGDPGAATARAAREGIRVFAVGVGTLEGSTVPESNTGGTSYKKDEKDQIVISRLAERLLLVMARATGGRYFRSESLDLTALALALDQLQKKQIAGGEYVEYEERYQMFLLAAFLLTFAGLLLSDRRGAWFDRRVFPWPRRRARRAGAAGALLALLLWAPAAQAGAGPLMREGLALERKGKHAEALAKYQEALVQEPDNVRIHYDQGRVLYRLNKHPEAVAEFQLGLLARDRRLRARSLYNIGNAQVRQGQLDAAIASYAQALVLDPKDLQAKQNLEYCWKLKAQPPDSTKQQQPQQPQQPPPQRQQPQPQQAQAQPQKGEISRDQADRMLQALQGKEREDMKKQQPRGGRPVAGGKDW
jgi:Ca-activated chloride channel family protein